MVLVTETQKSKEFITWLTMREASAEQKKKTMV